MQYINDYGLLDGKMGVAVYFYEYGRFAKNRIYNEFAERLLDEIIDTISNVEIMNSLEYSEGLGGVGWGIQYLMNRNFVEGQEDEVLMEFDNSIQEYIDSFCKLSIDDWKIKYQTGNEFMLGVDTYILSRPKSSICNIDNLRQIADFYLKILKSDNLFNMKFLNSCYTFLLYTKNKMEEKYTQLLINELKEAYKTSIKENLYVYSDIKVLDRLMNQKRFMLRIDYPKTSAKQDLYLQNDLDMYSSYFISELLSFDDNYLELKEDTINIYLDELIKDMPSANLSLRRGLAGVGLSIIKAM